MKEKRQNKFTSIAYGSFYTAVIIEVLIVLIDKSAYINPIEGRLFQLTFLLCLIKVCLTKYSIREYIVVALFFLLGAVSYFVTGRNEIVRLIMLIAACKDIDVKKCLKLVFYMTLIGCMLLVFLSLCGVLGTVSLTMDYGRGNEETRYVLGMGHPNALQCMIWALTTLALYLYGEKLKWYGYLFLLGINGFFFYLTDSKTSFLVAVFIIVYAGIINLVKCDIFRKICASGGVILFMVCVGISVIIAVNAYRIYNYVWYFEWTKPTQFFVYLDRALTGRIHSLLETNRWEGAIQTWSLFSSPENSYYFDLGWIRLFYWYGIIPASIFVVAMLILMIYCIRKKAYMAVTMMASFAVYSLMEAHGISVYLARNYVFFLFGMYWNQMLPLASEKECYFWKLPANLKKQNKR